MDCTYRGQTVRLPDFLIPGAARSGTTAVYKHLQQHPDVFLPEEKEPMFLSLWRIGKRLEWQSGKLVEDWSVPGLDDYIRMFDPATPRQLLGEASVWYLYDHAEVIRNIQTLYGDQAARLKILIFLRNPVNRAWSHYLLKRSRLKEPLAFREAIRPETVRNRLQHGMCYSYDYVGFSRYAEQVRAWQAAFPCTRIWIHETFFSDVEAGMREVAAFLDIPWHPALLIRKHVNAAGVYRSLPARALAWLAYSPNPVRMVLKHSISRRFRRTLRASFQRGSLHPKPIPEEDRSHLAAVLEPDIEELEQILEQSLDIWRGTGSPQKKST